jgi:hypothetical protein
MNIRHFVPAGSFMPGNPFLENPFFHLNLKNYLQALEIQNFHFSICSREKQTHLIIAKYLVRSSLTRTRAIFFEFQMLSLMWMAGHRKIGSSSMAGQMAQVASKNL